MRWGGLWEGALLKEVGREEGKVKEGKWGGNLLGAANW